MVTRTCPNPSRRVATLGAMAIFLALSGAALAAERTVHVGRGGTNFVDDASGTKVSTIAVGDTVTWVWEGSMEHNVTSGTCPGNGGGGGGYGYTGSACNPSQDWETSGTHGAGFTFSHTFTQASTYQYFCNVHQGLMTGKIIVQAATGGQPCDPSSLERLCLNNGRFEVTTEYATAAGASGHGTRVKLTDDSGYFWFFNDTNIEVVTKVLNGCGLTNSYWVFSAGLTDVGVTLTVRDTQTGAVYSYVNPLTTPGTVYVTQPATSAFPASCP